MLVTKQILVAIKFHSMQKYKKYYGSQWRSATVWLPTFFKNVFFCVQQKKVTHTGLEQLESE